LVLASGRVVRLSVREFELLVAMARRTGAIATRDELYATVWGGQLRHGDRSVDVYVSKLRGKLEAAMPDRRFIHTHPGFGYRFQPQPSPRETPSATILEPAEPQDGGEHLSRNVHTAATGG
jgi:DNA-binding response OmpR family regulator